MRAAFLDRDGTIISDYPDRQWAAVEEPEFLDGAIDALKALHTAGYKIIIITNQYLIGEGIITEQQYHRFSERFVETLRLNGIPKPDIFYCPHARTENCEYRKPRTGLIRQALSIYPGIDLKNSFMAGDSPADRELAARIPLRFFGIQLPCSDTVTGLREMTERLTKSCSIQ